MSKRVKCGDCYYGMDWALPRRVDESNYEYAKHCLNLGRNTIYCSQVMKTKWRTHQQYCKHFRVKNEVDLKLDDISQRELDELEEKIRKYENNELLEVEQVTERISNKCPCDMCGKDKKCKLSQEACQDYLKWEDDCLKKLAEYETAEEEGRFVVMPVKCGEILWHVFQDEVYKFEVSWLRVCNRNRVEIHLFGTHGYALCTYNGELDEGWYTTRKEAEKVLDVKQNESKN